MNQDLPQDPRLVEAIKAYDLQAVEAALANGADPNAGGRYTGYPLMTAIHLNAVDITHALIEHGADVNAGVDEGYTPIMEAVLAGNEEIVKLLLKNGANPDVYAAGMLPLSNAIRQGDLEIVQALLAAGADATLTDQGDNMLSIARENVKRAQDIVSLIEIAQRNQNSL